MEFALPFEHTFWVIPRKLLAGPYPGSHDPAEASRRLKALVQCGVRQVIDLMGEDEIRQADPPFLPYGETLERLAKEMGLEVSAVRISLRDQESPAPEAMKAVLDAIDRSLASDRPVYVHCWGGRGRTGTAGGCYRVRRGWSGIEGLKRLGELRQGASNGHLPSPKTEAQRQFVLSWEEWDRRKI
jgi:Polymorphic toxin system, DSP-PTPase phosphatase